MSITRTVNGTEYTLKTNGIPRALYCLADLPTGIAAEWFGYVTDDDYSARFFEYRGSWYDVNEFEVAAHDVKALGFDGVQGESYFSAVVVRWFDRDGEYRYDDIVVGYLYW